MHFERTVVGEVLGFWKRANLSSGFSAQLACHSPELSTVLVGPYSTSRDAVYCAYVALTGSVFRCLARRVLARTCDRWLRSEPNC